MAIKDLQRKVIEEFSEKAAIEIYSEDSLAGLWEREERIIDKYLKKGSSIIDLGCGTGRTTVPLVKKKYNVLGIDITPKFIQIAEEKARKLGIQIKYEIGDATNLKFEDESFDNALFLFHGWTQIPGKERNELEMELGIDFVD